MTLCSPVDLDTDNHSCFFEIIIAYVSLYLITLLVLFCDKLYGILFA